MSIEERELTPAEKKQLKKIRKRNIKKRFYQKIWKKERRKDLLCYSHKNG